MREETTSFEGKVPREKQAKGRASQTVARRSDDSASITAVGAAWGWPLRPPPPLSLRSFALNIHISCCPCFPPERFSKSSSRHLPPAGSRERSPVFDCQAA